MRTRWWIFVAFVAVPLAGIVYFIVVGCSRL